jgi:hypothetical protein
MNGARLGFGLLGPLTLTAGGTPLPLVLNVVQSSSRRYRLEVVLTGD